MGNVTITNIVYQNAGSEMKIEGRMTFSSSYSVGGETYTAKQFGLSKINGLELNPSNGYAFQPVYSTSKVKVLQVKIDVLSTAHHHSLQTFDEVKAVVADVATATTFPVCVNAVYALAGGVTGYMKVIPGDQAPATGECAVVLGGPKTFTFNAADAVTSAQLNYLYVATTDDDIGSATGTLAEVPVATNLSAITVPFVAYGY